MRICLHRGTRAAVFSNRASAVHGRSSIHTRGVVRGSTQDQLELTEKEAQNGFQASWAATRRSLAGKKDKRAGKPPQLDPGPCLENFKVVIVGTRKAASVGVVARALGAFECLSLCCVAPRAKVNSGRSLKTSCGAQYIINNAQVCDTLEEALQGSSYSVAFSRWISDGKQTVINGISHLSQQPELLAALAPAPAATDQDCGAQAARPCVALVFGRECEGLADEEIRLCSASCCITMGRLQESLSLSHAVCLVLGHLFEHRLSLMPPAYREHFRLSSSSASTGEESPVPSG